MMKKFNLYYYLFYIIYKFVKLTTKQELQDQVPSSAHAGYFIGLNSNLLTIFIFTRILRLLPKDYISFAVVYVIISVSLYYFNKYLFLKNEKYKEIESYYDKSNKFKKTHFILIAVFYMIFSIGTMILAGIYYKA